MKIVRVALLLVLSVVSAYANDSAVETAAGGLRLRKEHSVLMEKERLFISKELVEVDYEFRNTVDTPIVSEVAFPIPEFHFDLTDTVGSRDFSDFKAWVDGKPVKVAKELRAYVNGREVTSDLRAAGITIASFGNYPAVGNQLALLSPEVRQKLVRLGALRDTRDSDRWERWEPAWKVGIKYHWRQEFPPHQLVKVRHVYTPVTGMTPIEIKDLRLFKDSCLDYVSLKALARRVETSTKNSKAVDKTFWLSWVSYILTTANTWQTPIKDFELVVQREKRDLLTFCWDGPVTKKGDGRFSAKKTDFIPATDLKVYFMTSYD